MALFVPRNVNSKLNVIYLSGFVRLEREEGTVVSMNVSHGQVYGNEAY
jgi:hypothetical protein